MTDEGDMLSVKLDVRDLGGHLDTTFRCWSVNLATRVRMVIARLVLIFVCPFDFHGRLRVMRSVFVPGAFHGSEASLRIQVCVRCALPGSKSGLAVSLLPVWVQNLFCWMDRLVVIVYSV